MSDADLIADNGLSSFSLHRGRSDQALTIATLQQEGSDAGFGVDIASPAGVDAETAARRHLKIALESDSAPGATAPAAEGMTLEFKCLGTETLALTGTKTVKFRQVYNKVPVYGSLVTVELDEQNDLIGINSTMGAPEGVSPVAELAPAAARRAVIDAGGLPDDKAVGRIIFYYDGQSQPPSWRLCYLFEDVPLSEEARYEAGTAGDELDGLVAPELDVIVDANTGEVVARLPRSHDVQQTAQDELNEPRSIEVSAGGPGMVMIDSVVGVQTYDLGGRDLDRNFASRAQCANPPEPWSTAAVSAHANAAEVAAFLRSTLKRRGLDDQNGPLTSTINCTYWAHGPGGGEWHNAMWSQGQMYYGQRRVNGRLVSMAADLDVVAHEIVHGLTEKTAKLQYLGETGALNESYSDIFGIVIANSANPDPLAWDYRLGKTFRGTGVPLRDLADPTQHGQPAHMNDFRVLPLTRAGDWGGVHINSGIHNKAAHGIMTAVDSYGRALFSPSDLAAIFYVALTQHLSRTSRFIDSRRGVEAAALTHFRSLPQPEIDNRVAAIRDAFTAVGIQ